MDLVRKIAFVLLIIGGLNWGLVGLLDMDLVEFLQVSWLIKTVYILVGLSALVVLFVKKEGDSSESVQEPVSDQPMGSNM